MSCEGCGVGGWNGPVAGDPSNNSVLSATPAFGGIDVRWTYPATNPYAVSYVKLYRAPSSNFDHAVFVGEFGGSHYYDRQDNSTTWYYWIQIVSIHGTVGELIGPASAAARPLIEDLIEQLTGEIDEGALAVALKGKLDQISLINDNLLNEIMDRETGQTSLAEAIADAQAGVAEAHTFIINETNSRVALGNALVDQINGIAASVGGDYAAVIEDMQIEINELDDTVNAMYTVKLTVNDLVGGFGLANDGHEVEAGFDVDKFWVGRTSADKRKPFIIVGSETFIDEAVINKLTFSKLRDESGSFVVEGGKVKADYLNVNGLSVRDSLGNIILNAGTGAFLGNVTGAVNGTSASTLTGNVSTALTNANTALTSASTALTKLSDISNDGLLSPDEKPAVVAEHAVIVAEKTGISAQATAYGIGSAATTYNTAYNDLVAYLATLTAPVAWNNYTGNTTVVRTTFNSKFTDYYTARQALLNAILAASKTTTDSNTAGLANRLRSDAQNILSGAGGLATGTLSWDSSGNRTGGWGVGLTQKGLAAFNSSGVATFTLDGTTGDATFGGVLTAGAVNAVNTINIAGNAVTVPLTHSSSASYSSSGTILSYTFSMPSAGKLIVLWRGESSNLTDSYFRIYVDGVEAGYTRQGDAYDDAPTAMGFADISAGSHTVTVGWTRGTGDISHQKLVILGAQR